MSFDKLENIYKLLTEHNFDENIPDKFKCGKCKNILVKACQTRCGCRFCRSCVDEMLNNGCQFCPGITTACKMELLSTVQLDYRANNQISKLIMKCPEETCSYECELLEMSEHLRICGKKSVECPFYKLGCDMKKMTNDKLIEHFQLENYNHNKTLIDMIDNIKNEIDELRNEEINKLKTDLQSKNEKLKMMNSEMEIMKVEKVEMEKRMKVVEKALNDEISKLKTNHRKEIQTTKATKELLDNQMRIELKNIWKKIDEIELELKKRSENGKIESIKSELIEKIKVLQKNIYNKSINDNIKLEIKDVCKQTVDKSILQMGVEKKINELERKVENKINGIFEMMIYSVDTKRYKCGEFMSEYFSDRMHSYNLRLSIWFSYVEELWIHLFIYDDGMNPYLSFPFKAEVTINIVNLNRREVGKSITQYCQIDRPDNNSFKSSDQFIYSFSELAEKGILESNCFIVQCSIELR